MAEIQRHQPAPVWFDAQFRVGDATFTVGPFESPEEARIFGRRNEGGGASFLGHAERVGRAELARRIAVAQLHTAPAASNRRRGVITAWKDTAGFLTDSNGTSWFVSRDDLPGNRDELPTNTRVTFAGIPKPKPGKKYPQAHSLQYEQS